MQINLLLNANDPAIDVYSIVYKIFFIINRKLITEDTLGFFFVIKEMYYNN